MSTGNVEKFTSRVSKLDSVILDQEFYNFIKNQLINILDKVQLANWLHIYEPEFDLILSSIVWKLTVGLQQSTIGQRLLGLKYVESKQSQLLFYVFSVVVPYVNARLVSFLLRRNYQPAAKYNERVNTGLKILQVVNFCVFLGENKYLTLAHRFSRLRMIPATQKLPYPPGDSYQIRELLWHQFSDFLMIMIPFINLHIVKRYWTTMKKVWNSSSSITSTGVIIADKRKANRNVVAKCCHCNQDAVIPQYLDSCSFCYYCFKANQYGDESVKCTNCPHN